LPERRWKKEEVSSLLLSSAFQRAFLLDAEAITATQKLFSRLGFHAWESREARAISLLQEEIVMASQEEGTTFQDMLVRFAEEWTCGKEDASSAKEAAKAIKAIRALFSDLRTATDHKEKTSYDWAKVAYDLFEKYFKISFVSVEEKRDAELIIQTIQELQNSIEVKLSYSSFVTLFQYLLEENRQKNQSAARCELIFLSYDDLPYPAKIIHLLGADNDVDAPVIEALISAKDALSVSFQGFSFEEAMAIEPSSSVRTLMNTIEEGFETKSLVSIHPLLRHGSKEQLQKVEARQVAPRALLDTKIIDIALLRSTLKTPLKTYFKHTFGLTISEHEVEMNELKKYEIHALKKKTIETTKKEFLFECSRALRATGADSGRLQKAFKSSLEELYDERAPQRQAHTFSSVEFSLSVQKPQARIENVNEHYFLYPALEVDEYLITGTIDMVDGKGPLTTRALSKEAIFSALPELLIAAFLYQEKVSLFSLECNQSKEIVINEPKKALKALCDSVIACHITPFCATPYLVTTLLEKENPDFQKYEDRSYNDPYLELYLERASEEEIQELWKRSRDQAKTLYSSLASCLQIGKGGCDANA